MKLLVDIGNTRIKWALLAHDLASFNGVTYKDADLGNLLDENWGRLPTPATVVVACVGSKDLESQLTQWIQQQWHCSVQFIYTTAKAEGITNGYTNPAQLGIDRWLAVVAAHHYIPGDVCIFDCGTAITMDYVNAAGQHEGGLVFPGLRLLQSSLITNTAGCTAIQYNFLNINNQYLANNTSDGIQRGSLHAAIAILEYEAARLTRQLQQSPTFVITGGDAEALLPHLSFPCRHEPQLVLQGMAKLVQNN